MSNSLYACFIGPAGAVAVDLVGRAYRLHGQFQGDTSLLESQLRVDFEVNSFSWSIPGVSNDGMPQPSNEIFQLNSLGELLDLRNAHDVNGILAFPLIQGWALMRVGANPERQLASLRDRLHSAAYSDSLLSIQARAQQVVYAVTRPHLPAQELGEISAERLRVYSWNSGTYNEHEVLPLPDQQDWVDFRNLKPARVESDVTGIVTAVTEKAVASSFSDLRVYQAVGADMRRVRPWSTDRLSTGAALCNDDNAARGAAVGEAIERYCGNIPPSGDDHIYGSYLDLSKRYSLIHPDEFVLQGDQLPGANRRTTFRPFTPTSACHWVAATDLASGKTIWVPAFEAYVNVRNVFPEDPQFSFPALQGIAAGISYEAAVVSGIEEVIERDTTMGWWLNAPSVGAFRQSVESSKDVDMWTFELPNEFGIPVVAAVRKNHAEGLLNVGFAARMDIGEARNKAIVEAITLETTQRTYIDLAGLEKIQKSGLVDIHFLKRWREDRRYLEDYNTDDFRDVTSLMHQPQVALDPEAQKELLSRLHGTSNRRQRAVEDSGNECEPRTSENYLAKVTGRGYRVLVADLTTQDARMCNWHVIRTIIPGLMPNTPAAYPSLMRGRWRTYATVNGFAPRAHPNLWPLPHA